MSSRHVSILQEDDPKIEVRRMPEERSLYALLRHNQEMMLYLIEVVDAQADDPASYSLYRGYGELHRVTAVRTILAPQDRLKDRHCIEFRLEKEQCEGRIRFGHLGVGSADIAFYGKRDTASYGADYGSGAVRFDHEIIHAGGRKIVLADRLENIMHYVPRNSHMPEVAYRSGVVGLPEELRSFQR